MTIVELQTIYRENCIHDGILYDHQPRQGVHQAHLNALAAVQRAVEASLSDTVQQAPQRYSLMLVSAQTPMGETIQATTDHLGGWVKWEDVASLFDKEERK